MWGDGMTVRVARKLIHKRRCQGLECINCEYLTGLCSDPEVKEIVEAFRLGSFTYKDENGERVGYPSDRSGSVIFPNTMRTRPEGNSPADETQFLADIGLLDEVGL